MRPRELLMISALNRQIADVYAYAAAANRAELSEDEQDVVRDVKWRIIMIRAAADPPATGPYASREELMRVVRRSAFAKATGRSFVCRNRDGSWAWYCYPCLMREGDRLESTITYNREIMEFEECPVS